RGRTGHGRLGLRRRRLVGPLRRPRRSARLRARRAGPLPRPARRRLRAVRRPARRRARDRRGARGSMTSAPAGTRTSWWERDHGGAGGFRVAYFCMEFGIGEELPVYSGGLGVLAGDHLKAAADLGVPLVGVGLLYRMGYFRQAIDGDGQGERYIEIDPEQCGL